MTARALLPLHGSHGQFLKGAVITGVPNEIVAIWVADGAAEYFGQPSLPAGDDATEPAASTPATGDGSLAATGDTAATEGDPEQPADDPTATADGEAGSSPSGFEAQLGDVVELNADAGTVTVVAIAGSPEADAFRAASGNPDQPTGLREQPTVPAHPDPETATTGAPENASTRASRPRRSAGRHPSGEQPRKRGKG